MDGTVFNVPGTAANAQFFGRPSTSCGQVRSAYPQARVAALAECGTHAVFAAEVGPLKVHLNPDQAPAEELAALYAQRWEFEMCQPQCTHKWELVV
ncbi:hypothetical protein [Streptomyces carpinensis]|uniref:Uncharacterized protein n=1 Tax=Streptomyces carpinensis TaxID=66369 RepID=A0ABV1WFF6_9ACTN|nr:hypothetical protein [Streptomyces carpinensis]